MLIKIKNRIYAAPALKGLPPPPHTVLPQVTGWPALTQPSSRSRWLLASWPAPLASLFVVSSIAQSLLLAVCGWFARLLELLNSVMSVVVPWATQAIMGARPASPKPARTCPLMDSPDDQLLFGHCFTCSTVLCLDIWPRGCHTLYSDVYIR